MSPVVFELAPRAVTGSLPALYSAKNASPPHEKLKGCELFTVVEAVMNLCTSRSSSGDSSLRLRKAVRPGLAGASRAAPQAAGVKPCFKHVARNALKRDLNTNRVGKPYNQRYLRGHGVVDEKVTFENQFGKNIMLHCEN